MTPPFRLTHLETHVTSPVHPTMKLSPSKQSVVSTAARLFVLALLPVAALAQACSLQSLSSDLRLTQHVSLRDPLPEAGTQPPLPQVAVEEAHAQ